MGSPKVSLPTLMTLMSSPYQLLSMDVFSVNVLLYFSLIDDKISTSDGYLPVQDEITSKYIIVQYSGCWLVCSTVILLAVTCCCKNPIASQSAQPFLETLKGRKGGAEKNLPPSLYILCILKMLILRSVYFVSSCIFASKITFLY